MWLAEGECEEANFFFFFLNVLCFKIAVVINIIWSQEQSLCKFEIEKHHALSLTVILFTYETIRNKSRSQLWDMPIHNFWITYIYIGFHYLLSDSVFWLWKL